MEVFARWILPVYSLLRRVTFHAVLSLFLLSSPTFASQMGCRSSLAKIVSAVRQNAAKTPWEAAKGSVYPLWFIGKTTVDYFRSGKKSRLEALKEALWNRWLRDRGAMLIGASLMGLQHSTGMPLNQFHHWTSEFDDDITEEGIVVVIDNSSEKDQLAGVGSQLFESYLKSKYGSRAFLLKNIPLTQIPLALKKLSETHGPILKLDYYGSGEVGRLQGDSGSVSDMVGSSGHYPGTPIAPSDPGGELPLDPNGWYRDLFETKLDPAIFSRNAKIRFNADFLGNGPDGELFGRAVANSWLRKGGIVYTSNVTLLPDSIWNVLTPIRGLEPAYKFFVIAPNSHNKDRIDGPFLGSAARVRKHVTSGESTLRNEFELAWASGFSPNKIHRIHDSADIRHYSPLKLNAPEEIKMLPVREEEMPGDDTGKPDAVRLIFSDPKSAEDYLKYLEPDRELIDEPKIEGNRITIQLKPTAKNTIRSREYRHQLEKAENAKKKLKEVYQSHASEAEAQKYYEEYRRLLPLYVFPSFLGSNLPRDPKLYERLETLTKP